MPSYVITAVIDIEGCEDASDVADYIAGTLSVGLCSGDRLKTLFARELAESDCDCESRGWRGDSHDRDCLLFYGKGKEKE